MPEDLCSRCGRLMASKHLTLREMADELGVSLDQVKKIITSGELPAIDVGRGKRSFWRVARTDFDAWVKAQQEVNARRFKNWSDLSERKF